MEKLGAPYFCFHDRDIAPEGKSLAESNKNLDAVVKVVRQGDRADGNQAPLGHRQPFQQPALRPRRGHRANADAFAFAAAQVKKALEVTKELGGQGYTFWGGREGYQTLWNTDMKRELDHLARFMHMAVDYAKQIGFHGPVLLRAEAEGADEAPVRFRRGRLHQLPPRQRPGRPRKAEHRDEPRHLGRPRRRARVGIRRLRRAFWARSTPTRATCSWAGTPTSSPPTSTLTTKIMLVLLRHGGFTTGGLNFDAKVRRESFEPIDLFYAHIGGMDAFAKGLKMAAAILADGELARMVKERYASWDSGIGAEIEAGRQDFASLEKYMLDKGDVSPNVSGRQELFENVVNRYVF